MASYERGLRIPVPNRFGKEDLILRGLGAVSNQSISQPVASTSTGCGWSGNRREVVLFTFPERFGLLQLIDGAQ